VVKCNTKKEGLEDTIKEEVVVCFLLATEGEAWK
jgi:hypothetical protein